MPPDTGKAVLPPLLGPDDPPPVIVEGEARGGACLVLCDHASGAVPKSLGTLGLPESELRRHIAFDNGAAEAARAVAARFDAPLVMTGYSRLVIDCNRSPDDPTSIPLISETTLIPANRDLPPEEGAHRRAACFEPYHREIERLLDRFEGRGIVPPILSIHSFTPVFKGEVRPWHFGILWNRDPRIPVPLIAALEKVDGVVVGDNLPYSGRDEYGHTIATHGAARGLPHVLVEFRDDLLRKPADVARWADILCDALTPILADPALRRVQRF